MNDRILLTADYPVFSDCC